MPGYKTHMLVGLLSALGIWILLAIFKPGPPQTIHAIGGVVGAFIGILPDIDIRTSIVFKVWAASFALASIAFSLMLLSGYAFTTTHYVVAAFVSVIFLLSIFLKHRRIMHTYGMAAITSLPWAYYNPWLSLYAFVAYSSHIFIDKWRPDKILGGNKNG